MEKPEIYKVIDKLPSAEGHLIWEKDMHCIVSTIEKTQPKRILEIGFNIGHSAVMWLHSSNAILDSVDICKWPNTKHAAELIKDYYGERFNFFNGSSESVYNDILDNKYDLMFIDGEHSYAAVRTDIKFGLKLSIPYFLFDDFSDGVKRAVDLFTDKFQEIETFITERENQRPIFKKLYKNIGSYEK